MPHWPTLRKRSWKSLWAWEMNREDILTGLTKGTLSVYSTSQRANLNMATLPVDDLPATHPTYWMRIFMSFNISSPRKAGSCGSTWHIGSNKTEMSFRTPIRNLVCEKKTLNPAFLAHWPSLYGRHDTPPVVILSLTQNLVCHYEGSLCVHLALFEMLKQSQHDIGGSSGATN